MILDEYEAQIINAIVNDLNPTTACTNMGLCPGKFYREFVTNFFYPPWENFFIEEFDLG